MLLCPEQVDSHTLLRGDLTESVSVESLFITGRFNLREVRTCSNICEEMHNMILVHQQTLEIPRE